MNDLVFTAASLIIGMAGAAGTLTRRLGLAPQSRPRSDPPRLENADVAVSLDQQRSHHHDSDHLHVVVENCGRGPARDIDVALLTVEAPEQVNHDVAAEVRPKHRIRLEALHQGERRAVPVTALPGPIVAARCRWSDEFADYERHRLLKVV